MPLSMHFLPDEPITAHDADLLGFSPFVADLKTAILYTQTPFVYGVLGDWGTGKTSILRLLEAEFHADQGKSDSYVVPIWFNAWEYENETNIIYPLLHVIKRSYDDFREAHGGINPQPFLNAFRDVVATGALVLGDIGFRSATKLLTGASYSLEDVTKQYAEVTKRQEVTDALEGWTNQLENLKQTFANLLAAYKDAITTAEPDVPADSIRFAILVDDLDRCLPDTTIRVLESIKNYLTVPDAVFVLGLNALVVYQGIRHKYNHLDINGREYLEKILNYTFYVPEPDVELLVKFVEKRIGELTGGSDASAEYAWYFTEFGRVLRDCRFYNPRKIKRILNHYLFFLNRYDSDSERNKRPAEFAALKDWMHTPTIIRLLVIAEYFPEIFPLFLHPQPEHLNRLNFGDKDFSVSDFEQTFGIRIAEQYPQLARMRDLFRLAELRDQRKPDLRQHAQAVFSITRLL